MRLEFEYIQTFPSLVWTYHQSWKESFLLFLRQGPRIAFPAVLKKEINRYSKSLEYYSCRSIDQMVRSKNSKQQWDAQLTHLHFWTEPPLCRRKDCWNFYFLNCNYFQRRIPIDSKDDKYIGLSNWSHCSSLCLPSWQSPHWPLRATLE